eukprot:1551475-Rhodomonas_salina.1
MLAQAVQRSLRTTSTHTRNSKPRSASPSIFYLLPPCYHYTMVRPKADEQHKQLVVYLTHALTVPSEHENPTVDTIARIGEHS